MDGRVLELPSERIRAEGEARGIALAKKQIVINLQKLDMPAKKIAETVELTLDEVKEILKETD